MNKQTALKDFAAAMTVDGMVLGFDVIANNETAVVYKKMNDTHTVVTTAKFFGTQQQTNMFAFLNDLKEVVPPYAQEDIASLLEELTT